MIKVVKKDFDKLPQLDRIEYRQKRDYLSKHFNSNFMWYCLLLWTLIFILGSLFVGLCFGGEAMLNFMIGIDNSSMWVAISLTSCLIADLIMMKLYLKEWDTLQNQYFKKSKGVKNGRKRK